MAREQCIGLLSPRRSAISLSRVKTCSFFSSRKRAPRLDELHSAKLRYLLLVVCVRATARPPSPITMLSLCACVRVFFLLRWLCIFSFTCRPSTLNMGSGLLKIRVPSFADCCEWAVTFYSLAAAIYAFLRRTMVNRGKPERESLEIYT